MRSSGGSYLHIPVLHTISNPPNSSIVLRSHPYPFPPNCGDDLVPKSSCVCWLDCIIHLNSHSLNLSESPGRSPIRNISWFRANFHQSTLPGSSSPPSNLTLVNSQCAHIIWVHYSFRTLGSPFSPPSPRWRHNAEVRITTLVRPCLMPWHQQILM